MNNNLLININKNNNNELIPYYDTESNILEIRNRHVFDWPYGFDIDGNIVFDLDKNKELSNVDILIPKELWIVKSHLENYFCMKQEKGVLTFPQGFEARATQSEEDSPF